MELILIKVESYAGYKADEYPTCFYWDNEKYEIKEIIDRWYQIEHRNNFPAADYFKVFTVDNKQFVLKHNVEQDEWFLIL